jgi:hypothetical protein
LAPRCPSSSRFCSTTATAKRPRLFRCCEKSVPIV